MSVQWQPPKWVRKNADRHEAIVGRDGAETYNVILTRNRGFWNLSFGTVSDSSGDRLIEGPFRTLADAKRRGEGRR